MPKLACKKSATALGNALSSKAGLPGAAEHHSPDAHTRNIFQPTSTTTAVKCGTSLLHRLFTATLLVRARSGLASSEIQGGPSRSPLRLQGRGDTRAAPPALCTLGQHVLQKKRPPKTPGALQHIQGMKYLQHDATRTEVLRVGGYSRPSNRPQEMTKRPPLPGTIYHCQRRRS